MLTNAPVIERELFDERNSPCLNPTTQNYDALLSYHQIGNDYTDKFVADIMQAYLDFEATRVRKFATQSYNDMQDYANLNCEEHYLKIELSASGALSIIPKKVKGKKIPGATYPIHLFRGLYRILDNENEPLSNLFFEFTHGRAKFNIGKDASKWYEDDCILISIMVRDNAGSQRHLGVYDISIPPDDK